MQRASVWGVHAWYVHYVMVHTRYLVCAISEGRGALAGPPAPLTGYAPVRMPESSPTGSWCTGPAFWTFVFCTTVWDVCIAIEGQGVSDGTPSPAPWHAPVRSAIKIDRLSLLRNEEQVPARRQQQRDMQRPIFQPSANASWCTRTAFLCCCTYSNKC